MVRIIACSIIAMLFLSSGCSGCGCNSNDTSTAILQKQVEIRDKKIVELENEVRLLNKRINDLPNETQNKLSSLESRSIFWMYAAFAFLFIGFILGLALNKKTKRQYEMQKGSYNA